jgi:hypothetical protein
MVTPASGLTGKAPRGAAVAPVPSPGAPAAGASVTPATGTATSMAATEPASSHVPPSSRKRHSPEDWGGSPGVGGPVQSQGQPPVLHPGPLGGSVIQDRLFGGEEVDGVREAGVRIAGPHAEEVAALGSLRFHVPPFHRHREACPGVVEQVGPPGVGLGILR